MVFAMSAPAISDEEKRSALTRVLESRTFGRSDQLRAFLRYVCEAELEGRALYKSRVTPEIFTMGIYDRALVDMLMKSRSHVRSRIW